MDNIQSVHKLRHVYSVTLFLLFVSKILAFNFMLMSVKYSVQIFSICSLQVGSLYRSIKQLCRMFQFSSVNTCICTFLDISTTRPNCNSELEKIF